MRKPENFKKIDDMEFTTKSGIKYKFSLDLGTGILWVFQIPDISNYCLAFIIDWEKETYEIKRAKNGDGTNWIDTLHDAVITIESIKTINAFIDWAKFRINALQFYYHKK